MISRKRWSCLSALAVPILLLSLASPSEAASPFYKDVCTSGCTYSSVQAAIDSINDSDSTHVYTIFLDAGVLSSDTSINFNGKDYINFVGRGMGTSILRASAQWFANVNAQTTSGNFVSLDDSTNVTLSGISIDAKTNDTGLYPNSIAYAGVMICPTVGGKVSIEGSEIQGVTYGLSGQSTVSNFCGLVDVLNSKVNSSTIALWGTYEGTWHIFATELRATDNGVRSGLSGLIQIAALSTNSGDFTVWGSHLHAESSVTAGANDVNTVRGLSATITVIGSTLHVKITTTQPGSNRRMLGGYLSSGTLNLIGTEILYESPASLAGGFLGGIGFNNSGTINLVGSTFRDGGGSGGTTRSDLWSLLGSSFPGLKIAGTKVSSFASLTGTKPANVAKEFDTLGTQKGTSTFVSSGTVAVVLPVALPDTNYRVSVSANQNETIWVTSKTVTGFTLNSSNSSSTATVEWLLMR